MSALGERFRAAREARGLTLSDVAEQIRIRSVYLAAIEDESWASIGAPVYIRGFLRTYARFLGLDPEEVVTEFNGETSAPSSPIPTVPGAAPKTTYLAEEQAPARALSPLIWIASLIAVVLIAIVVYNEATLRARQTAAALPSNTPPASPAATATALAAAASPSPLAGPNTLVVRISAPSWLRVTVDGNVSMEGTFPAGTVRQFHGKIAMLRIGNAGGVEIIVDGKSLGRLGSSGDVVERSFTL
ncbi:MAG TPA: RodZ domain-containing protein [Candidatus Aquilonibacter sp.]